MPRRLNRLLAIFLSFIFLFEQTGFAQVAGELDISGHFLKLSHSFTQDKFRPLHLRYLSYDTLNNNFKLLLDKGDTDRDGSLRDGSRREPSLSPGHFPSELKQSPSKESVPPIKGTVLEERLKKATQTLLNYFFIGVTLPNSSFWVNLRPAPLETKGRQERDMVSLTGPDSEDSVIDDELAQTDIGKILLEQDLQLKKDTAKATSPETPEGKDYWNKLYQKAEELFGSSNITIPTLTRPWIVPDEIIIRETPENAYIYKATLKVMLEEDYLAKGLSPQGTVPEASLYSFKDPRLKELNAYSTQLIKELIIPKLTKDINTSKRYAPLRQVYYSLILAQWFKSRFYGKGGLYSWLIDQKNLKGLTSKTPWDKTTYFKEYQKSFNEGEYNLKEPTYTPFGQTIRSYMSGGIAFGGQEIGPAITRGALPGGSREITRIITSRLSSSPLITASINGGSANEPYSGVKINIAERDIEPPEVKKQTSSPISEPSEPEEKGMVDAGGVAKNPKGTNRRGFFKQMGRLLTGFTVFVTLTGSPYNSAAITMAANTHKFFLLAPALKNPNPLIRTKAIRDLSKIEDERVPGLLIAAFDDVDSNVRGTLSFILSRLEHPRTIDHLIQATRHANPLVRRGAVSALGRRKDSRAMRPLVAALQDPEAEVRMLAAWRLGEIGHIQGISAVVPLLKDEAQVVRYYVGIILERSRHPFVTDLVISALQDSDVVMRREASVVLGRRRDPKAISPLIKMLRDPSKDVRFEVILALRRFEDPRATQALLRMLDKEIHSPSDSKIIRQILWAFGEMRDPQTVKPLVTIARSGPEEVRGQAIEALAELRDPRTHSVFVKVLNSPDQQIRRNAIRAIGNLQRPDKTVTERLVQLLVDPEVNVEAAEALAKLRDARGLAWLLNKLTDSNADVRLRAASVLIRLRHPRGEEELFALLKDKDAERRSRAASILSRQNPNYVRKMLEAHGLIQSPRPVLPSQRGPQTKVAVVIIDSFRDDLDHGALVRERVEEHLSLSSAQTIQFYPFLPHPGYHFNAARMFEIFDQLNHLVKRNPDTVFLVNVSLRPSLRDPQFVLGQIPSERIAAMGQHGMVFIAAAGNENETLVFTHPPFDNLWYVGAVDPRTGQKADVSSVGPAGFLRVMTDQGALFGRTSSAAPKVLGRLAEALVSNPQRSIPDTMGDVLRQARPMPDPLWHAEWRKSLVGAGFLPMLFLFLGGTLAAFFGLGNADGVAWDNNQAGMFLSWPLWFTGFDLFRSAAPTAESDEQGASSPLAELNNAASSPITEQNKVNPLNRRDFLKGTIASGVSVSASGPFKSLANMVTSAPKTSPPSSPPIGIEQISDYEATVPWSTLKQRERGVKVALKVNGAIQTFQIGYVDRLRLPILDTDTSIPVSMYDKPAVFIFYIDEDGNSQGKLIPLSDLEKEPQTVEFTFLGSLQPMGGILRLTLDKDKDNLKIESLGVLAEESEGLVEISASSPGDRNEGNASSPLQTRHGFVEISATGRNIIAAEVEYSPETLSKVRSNTDYNRIVGQIRQQEDFVTQFLSLLEHTTDTASTLEMLRPFLQYIIAYDHEFSEYGSSDRKQIVALKGIYEKIQDKITPDANYRRQLLQQIIDILKALNPDTLHTITQAAIRAAVLEFEHDIKYNSEISGILNSIAPFTLYLTMDTPLPVNIDRGGHIVEINPLVFLPYRPVSGPLDEKVPEIQKQRALAIQRSDPLSNRSLELALRRITAERVIENILILSGSQIPLDILVDITLILLEEEYINKSAAREILKSMGLDKEKFAHNYDRSRYLWQLSFYGNRRYVTLLRQLVHHPSTDAKVERIYKYLEDNFGLAQRYNLSPGATASLEAIKEFIRANLEELKRGIEFAIYRDLRIIESAMPSTQNERLRLTSPGRDGFDGLDRKRDPAETKGNELHSSVIFDTSEPRTDWRGLLGAVATFAVVVAIIIGVIQFMPKDTGKPTAVVSEYTYRRAPYSEPTEARIQRIVRFGGFNPLAHRPTSGPAGLGGTVIVVAENLFTLSGYEANEMFITGLYNAVGDGGFFTQEGSIRIIPQGKPTSEEVHITLTLAPMAKGSQVRMPTFLNGQIMPGSFLNGKLSLGQDGILAVNEEVGPSTITLTVRKWDQNGRIQASQPITEWMQREFQDLPADIKKELEEAKLLPEKERLNVVARILNRKFAYSTAQEVRLSAGTWNKFLDDVLRQNKRFVSDCDVLSIFAFLFNRYLGLETVFVLGYSNAEGIRGITPDMAHGTLIVRIDGKWVIFETTDIAPLAPSVEALPADRPSRTSLPAPILEAPPEPPQPLLPSKHQVRNFSPNLAPETEPKQEGYKTEKLLSLPDFPLLEVLEGSIGINTGDVLTRIAETYYGNGSLAMARLIAAENNIVDPQKIYAGDPLDLPQQLVHTVKGGDTFSRIARLYNIKPSELKKMNRSLYNERPGVIEPGDKLVVAERKALPKGASSPLALTEEGISSPISDRAGSSPLAEQGRCVTRDTLLPILPSAISHQLSAREYILKPIVEVKSGDYVLSLNEETQTVEPHRINGLLDMGVKLVFKLTTASGRSIKTTANHPYLTAKGWVKVSELKAGDEIACPVDAKHLDVRVPMEEGFTRLFSEEGKKGADNGPELTYNKNKRPADYSGFGLSDFGFQMGNSFLKAFFCNFQYRLLSPFFNFVQNLDQGIGAFVTQSVTQNLRYSDYCHYLSFGALNKPYHILKYLSSLFAPNAALAQPTIESDILWDKIVSIEPLPPAQVYDIEVEGTHNFIGNGIFAHNTYIGTEELKNQRTKELSATSSFFALATGGALKSVGIDGEDEMSKIDILALQDWERKAEAEEVETREINGLTVKAKFIYADLIGYYRMPKGLFAYHFYDKQGNLVIVTHGSLEESIVEEAVYHEAREAYWIAFLSGEIKGAVPNQEQRAEIARKAHILAAAEESVAFEGNRLTSYHQQQLACMSTEKLTRLRDEVREQQRGLARQYLTRKTADKYESYADKFRQKIEEKLASPDYITIIREIRGFTDTLAREFGLILDDFYLYDDTMGNEHNWRLVRSDYPKINEYLQRLITNLRNAHPVWRLIVSGAHIEIQKRFAQEKVAGKATLDERRMFFPLDSEVLYDDTSFEGRVLLQAKLMAPEGVDYPAEIWVQFHEIAHLGDPNHRKPVVNLFDREGVRKFRESVEYQNLLRENEQLRERLAQRGLLKHKNESLPTHRLFGPNTEFRDLRDILNNIYENKFLHAVESRESMEITTEDIKVSTVTPYAGTSQHELWAESLTAYFLCPNVLEQKDPIMFSLMQQVVRNTSSGTASSKASSPLAEKGDSLGQCVTGDTLLPILSEDRSQKTEDRRYILKPIIEVKTGDYVLSLNEETQAIEPHRIKGLLDMGVKPVFKLITASGRSIKTTANHPYLTNKGWVKVSELRVGDEIGVPRDEALETYRIKRRQMTTYRSRQESRTDIRADKDGFELPQFQSRSKDNSISRREIMLNNILIGIGNMRILNIYNPYSSQRYIGSKLFQGGSEVSLSNMSPVLNTVERRDKFSQGKASNQNLVFLRFKELNYSGAADLQMVTFNQGAGIKEIKHYLPFFSHTRNFFRQIPFNLAQTFVDFLQRRSFFRNPPSGDILTSRTDRQAFTNQFLNSHIFDYRHNLLLSFIKDNILLNCLSRLFLAEAEAVSTVDSAILWDKIVSIEPLGYQQVYDIEVEGTHNFIGNGIFAHNTFIDTGASSPMSEQQFSSSPMGRRLEYLTPESNYGVLNGLDAIKEIISRARAENPQRPILILLDGRGGVGKTTLTSAINVNEVHFVARITGEKIYGLGYKNFGIQDLRQDVLVIHGDDVSKYFDTKVAGRETHYTYPILPIKIIAEDKEWFRATPKSEQNMISYLPHYLKKAFKIMADNPQKGAEDRIVVYEEAASHSYFKMGVRHWDMPSEFKDLEDIFVIGATFVRDSSDIGQLTLWTGIWHTKQPSASSPMDASAISSDKGGIDLRALPIVTQPMSASPLGRVPDNRRDTFLEGSSFGCPDGKCPVTVSGTVPNLNFNLDKEWQQIEKMTQAGLIPSNERIREYLQVSCSSEDCSQRIDKVLSLFADILRLEEERVLATEPALREMLVLLESDKNASELQVALSQIEVMPKEVEAIEQ